MSTFRMDKESYVALKVEHLEKCYGVTCEGYYLDNDLLTENNFGGLRKRSTGALSTNDNCKTDLLSAQGV